MVEHEVREMFKARVRTSPTPSEAAAKAIRRGRRIKRRRQVIAGGAAVVAFAAGLATTAAVRGAFNGQMALDDSVIFDMHGGADQPIRDTMQKILPTMALPLDVHVGKDLWTSDGRQLTLSGLDSISEVVRVPSGWLYSDDIRLRLLTLAGNSIMIKNNVGAWTVSPDGTKLALTSERVLSVQELGTNRTTASTDVPTDAQPVAFQGERVILRRYVPAGHDYWSGSSTSYTNTTNQQVVAVYTSASGGALGLVRDETGTCLVELDITGSGLKPSLNLGCGDVPAAAAEGTASLSPGGDYLAVPSATGLHVIDVHQSHLQALSRSVQDSSAPLPAIMLSCASRPGAEGVWSDAKTVLTISENAGIIACETDGDKFQVPLPAGVTSGWELVRRYGVHA